MDQEVEDLGLKRNQIGLAAQFAPVRVNNAFFK
jgi:hypothetical protein